MGASRAAVRLGTPSDDTTALLCGGPRGKARSIAIRKPLVCRTFDIVLTAVRPRNGGHVFRYRLHSPDGGDLGEATYAVMIKPGEEILVDNGRRLRVLAVVPFEDDESPFVELLQVDR